VHKHIIKLHAEVSEQKFLKNRSHKIIKLYNYYYGIKYNIKKKITLSGYQGLPGFSAVITRTNIVIIDKLTP